MKVAVSGATGLIGRPLVDRLLRAGHQVRALVRSPELHFGEYPGEVEVAHFDALEKPMKHLLHGCEALIHLAGEPIAQRWTEDSRRAIRMSRVQGTAAILVAARESGSVKHVLSGSAIGYYGPRGAEPLDESAPPGDDFVAQLCVDWEKEALEARAAGMRVALLRTGVVLHPKAGALAKMLLPFKLGVGGKIGSGEQYMSWIAHEDQLGAILHVLQTPSLEGPVNLTAPNPVTNAEFTRALGAALHRPARLPVPKLALRALYGEMSQVVVTGQRVIPRKLLESGFRFACTDLETTLRDLLGGRTVVPATA